MEALQNILYGFSIALSPMNLLYCLVGCLIGTLVGVLPGFGPSAAISLLLPITFGLDITGAIIMLAGIFYGSQYGGSTTSILVNIPGETSSVMTCLGRVPDGETGTRRTGAGNRRLRLPHCGDASGHRADVPGSHFGRSSP